MYEDKTLVCKECGNEFVFTAGEQEFYAEKGFTNEPQRCKACRLYPICRAGGCKRTQLSEDYCEAYKKFFTACLPLFRVFMSEKPPQNGAK